MSRSGSLALLDGESEEGEIESSELCPVDVKWLINLRAHFRKKEESISYYTLIPYPYTLYLLLPYPTVRVYLWVPSPYSEGEVKL